MKEIARASVQSLISDRCQIQIFYSDDGYCSRSQRNILNLITIVKNDPETRTRSAQLARRVLKYRKLLHFVEAIDVGDPDFDAALFFGVEWTKVESVGQVV